MPDHHVDASDTAAAIGSGDVSCLGTPRLLAWFEAATCDVSQALLDESQTTVGTAVELEHLAPSPVGSAVSVTATIREQTARWIDYDVTAVEPVSGRLLARGTVTRAIVDRRTFLDRLGQVATDGSDRGSRR
ncbi:thioesterase family protein [Nocardioides ultimimeridianus]